MICMESDEDVVFFSKAMGGFCEDDRAESSIFDAGAGRELATASRDLNDAIGLGFGKRTKTTVDGGDAGDVDGGIGITTFLGGIKHGTVLSRSCDGHGGELVVSIGQSDKGILVGVAGNPDIA